MKYARPKANSKQLLDYYVLKEYVLTDKRRGYAARVVKNLADSHAIKVQERDVYRRVERVLAGDSLRPSADVSGTPSIREGKDQNYAAFISLVDIFLPRAEKRAYVGLPANQLDDIASRIGGSILAVERDSQRTVELEKFKNFIQKRRRDANLNVASSDIWMLLQGCKDRFNIFDLDLMCPLTEDTFNWAEAVYRAAQPGFTVLNLTTTVGRSITKKNYERRVTWFSRNLCSAGFKPVGNSRFPYRDRHTPMRCERYVLYKPEQENGEEQWQRK
jgi:hypothetical protein